MFSTLIDEDDAGCLERFLDPRHRLNSARELVPAASILLSVANPTPDRFASCSDLNLTTREQPGFGRGISCRIARI